MNPIPIDEQKFIEPVVGNTMLELGNKKNINGTYKEYFESLGINHTSVDWNGMDGALKLDLRQPLNLGQFDMVTNIGTTEHVDNQFGVWENIHNAVKVGGVLVSITPKPGNWHWHGLYYPTYEFYENFAKNGYAINILSEYSSYPRVCIAARLTKTENLTFTMPSGLYENTECYNRFHRKK